MEKKKYANILEISKDEYENFNKKIPTYNLFQKYDFSMSKKYNYEDVKMLGLFIDEKLEATTQILIENIPYIKKKMGSSIKGINIDFNNEKLLELFKKSMKNYLKHNNFLLFRVDFPVAYKLMNRDFNDLTIEEEKKRNFPVDKNIKTKLKNSGFTEFFVSKNYMGRSPQYSMLVQTTSTDIIKKQMNRSVKRAIKIAEKYELNIEMIEKPLNNFDTSQNYLNIFYDLHKKNAAKNNINILPYEYYENLFQSTDNLKLFLVSIDTANFLKVCEEEVKQKENSRNIEMLKIATKQNETGQRKIYIVGHISGFYNKLGYDLFTGLDYKFKELGSKEALMNYIFEYASSIGIENYDFWGILGELDNNSPMLPIYNFKKKFSNTIVQYPGFWDIYTNKLLYKIFVKYSKRKYSKKNK